MSDDYVRALEDELAMHQRSGNVERARQVLDELQRIAPKAAEALGKARGKSRATPNGPRETREGTK